MATSLEGLNQVLSLLANMLEKAEQQLWDDLIKLEEQRQFLIESTFPLRTSGQNERAILQKIVEINKQLQLQCIDAKDEVQKQLLSFNGNKKAMSAYQQK